jgi:hypothetical protein
VTRGFTAAERRLIRAVRTPIQIQRFLNRLPYNTEPPPGRATLRSFRGVVRTGTAHCLEGAIAAAVVMEQHGYPPLVMSLESIDELDHVMFIYQAKGRWGSVARSRDPALHGRRPVFHRLRDLAWSYVDPYVDHQACLKGYGAVDLRVLDPYDWRLSRRNVWKVEELLLNMPHRAIRPSPARVARLRTRFKRFTTANPGRKPMYFDQRSWSALPAEYRRA